MNSNFHFDIIAPKGGHVTLYIGELFDYKVVDQIGYIEFDGYLYYDLGNETKYDRKLSNVLLMVHETSKTGVQDTENACVTHYACLSNHLYEVELTHRDILKNTDKLSTIEEDDGTEMDVCFFPTNHQRIHFKILREILEGEATPAEYYC